VASLIQWIVLERYKTL